MADKNEEIRRLALLKSAVGTMSPFSVINVALQLLEQQTEPVTVEKLFSTASEIADRLPDLKRKLDELTLSSITHQVERWVMGEDLRVELSNKSEFNSESFEDFIANFVEQPTEKDSPADGVTEQPAASTTPPPVQKDEAIIPEVLPPERAEEKTEKTGEMVVGTIDIVSKSGKGLKIGGEWYNITTFTEMECENPPKKGDRVEIGFSVGKTGSKFIKTLKMV